MDIRNYVSDGKNYAYTITQIARQGPAQSAGVQQNDVVLGVDNVSAVNRPLCSFLNLMCGDPGTVICLVVLRKGQKISFEMSRSTRDKIKW